jgi:hypothetical protein
MRVQLRHFIEQLRVGRSGFLQPIEVLQITVQGKVSRSTTMNLSDERISCPDLAGITNTVGMVPANRQREPPA